MSAIVQHVKYAVRQLSHSRGLAVRAVLTLALGIGANVAVFSVMNGVLLNPSGIPNPDRGLVIGLAATLLAGRVPSSMLFATRLFHPLTLLATSALLTGTVVLASYLPARRASRLDPMPTLREE